MSAQLMCITSGGGLPVFTRQKGNAESLPFSTIGSLNGVHMFGKSLNIELLDTISEDYTVVWREFFDSLIFIGISSGCTTEVLSSVLDCAASAMVMIVGLDEIKAQRNIERLKRELRICYPIIDRLLDSVDYGDTHNKHSSDLTSMVEVILTSENNLIQIVLDSYTECVDSMYSCVLIHGKIVAATESWWSLEAVELKLLSLLATVENTLTSKDIPVFLPKKSPNVAFRFVACTLVPDVQVCCLCGPEPALEDIERSASQCFKSTLEILASALQCHPRNFPASVQLDSGILGVLLVNIPHGKYTISRNIQSHNKRQSSGSHRLDILRTFFYQAVLPSLAPELRNTKLSEKTTVDTTARETYWCSEYHKCHALRSNHDIICVLFSSNVPTPVMRKLSLTSLPLLTGDKQFCW